MQWHLVHLHCCAIITTSLLWNFHLSHLELYTQISMTPHSFLPLASGNHYSTFVSMNLATLGTSKSGIIYYLSF